MSTAKRVSGIAILAVFTVNAFGTASYGKTAFYGPTPYLSRADSPFDLSGLGTSFWLEDFEDGELNTPGIQGVLSIAPPGLPTTDSVDADDGVIDGSGSFGGAARGGGGGCTNAEPPFCWDYATFEFSAEALVGLPTAVGFAWTDGFPYGIFGQPSSFSFTAFDLNGDVIASQEFFALGNPPENSPEGETSEDVFIGVRYDAGISAIELLQSGIPTSHFEFDHLQYGYQVPEPSSAALLLAGGFGIAALRFRKRR